MAPQVLLKSESYHLSQYLKEDKNMQGIVKQFDELVESFNTQGTHLMKQLA